MKIKRRQIVLKGFRFYWKTHLASGLAVMCAVAVLVGALSSGDSIRATLAHQTRMRLGQTRLAVSSTGLFRSALARDLSEKNKIKIAPVLSVKGFAENADGSIRAGGVQILGVDSRFWALGPQGEQNPKPIAFKGGVAVSCALAQRLGITSSQEIIVRTAAPGGMAIEAAMTPDEQKRIAFRRTVDAVVTDEQFGAFDLFARSDSGLNVFVPLEMLNEWFGFTANDLRANLLLVASPMETSEVLDLIHDNWQLGDAGLSLADPNVPGILELRSESVFFPDTIVQSLTQKVPAGLGVLTYFVNEFRISSRTTPYSFVCALDAQPQAGSFGSLGPDEIIINEWLADDLKASEGDKVEIRYFVPAQGKSLSEQTATFTIKAVVPMMGAGADASLMPAFAALADAENCRDWKPGIPIDLSRIRPADEQYWQKYKGAPKAFVAMKAAKLLWSSRFGSLTAIRYSKTDYDAGTLTKKILAAIEPPQAGFFVSDVYDAGQKAAAGTTDFGGLIMAMSFFLIVASLILAGLVYAFALQRRCGQAGILSAVGLSSRQIVSLFITEQAAVGLSATLAGIPAGAVFARIILGGLNTIWADAAGGLQVVFAMRSQTVFIAGGVSLLLSLAVFGWKLRRLLNRPVADLLERSQEMILPKGQSILSAIVVALLLTFAVFLAVYGNKLSAQNAPGAFFGSGAAVLAALSLMLSSVLSFIARQTQRPSRTLLSLAVRNAARCKGRSLGVAGMLAIGVFAVFSVAGFHKTATTGPGDKNSGTGGFSLWSQCDIPLATVPNVDNSTQRLITTVGLRQYSEESASCLNLSLAQRPIIWGVCPKGLAGRFRFQSVLDKTKTTVPWELLSQDLKDDVVPAIGDYATVYWALHKKLGDSIDYLDQTGRLFRLKIVGLLDNSILQGGLIIDEKQFLQRFGDTQGWSVVLIDMPVAQSEAVAKQLNQAFSANGFEAMRTTERLNRFHQVENTYIAIFMALGSLGLILGSVGMGLVVMLNVLDRAGELAMMRAIGFEKKALIRILFIEHAGLLAAGLVMGTVSAVVAAGPRIAEAGQFPWRFLAVLAVILGGSGFCWVWLSAQAAIRGNLLEPLRKE